jgi:predicted nucleotidyltransferase
MELAAEYRDAQHDEHIARLRRVLSLRAMIAAGMSQREVAEELGISQSAVSQQLKSLSLNDVHPGTLLEAASPILKALAENYGYARLAVFGSAARHQARRDSDIDLLVEAPEGTSSFGFVRFEQLIERVLNREVDLVAYGGLQPGLDDDIRRDAVLL